MSARRLLLAVTGLIVWSSAFVTLYAVLSVGCAAGVHRLDLLGANALTVLLLAVFMAHLTGLGGLQWYSMTLWRARKDPTRSSGYLAVLTCVITAVSIFSLLFLGLPILMVPPCV
jgi:LytS/YehU family sensor histidine kinase